MDLALVHLSGNHPFGGKNEMAVVGPLSFRNDVAGKEAKGVREKTMRGHSEVI